MATERPDDGFDVTKERRYLKGIADPWQHLLCMLALSREEAMQRLEGFRLDGVVQQMRCFDHRLRTQDLPRLFPGRGRLPPLPERQTSASASPQCGTGLRTFSNPLGDSFGGQRRDA